MRAYVDRIARRPVQAAAAAALAGVLGGGSVYSLAEAKTSLPDGWWWAFVSMTTVGYGDYSPKTTEIRFIALFVIATGIAATAILTAALAGRITELRLSHAPTQTPELDDDITAVISELERIRATCNDPRVLAALRESHHERNTPA